MSYTGATPRSLASYIDSVDSELNKVRQEMQRTSDPGKWWVLALREINLKERLEELKREYSKALEAQTKRLT